MSPTASGTRERDQPQQQPVVGPLERGARVAERARRGGQPGRAALRADRRRLEERGALDRERARPHRLARARERRAPTRRSGWPRPARARPPTPPSRRRPPGRRPSDARGRRPPPGRRGTLAVDPVAHDHRLRRDQRGEPVERALGADLLERPDRDVRDQDPEEQRVLPRPEGDRQHAEEEQDPVRDVQRVGADDAARRSGSSAGAAAARAPPGAVRPRPRSGRRVRFRCSTGDLLF